jgi:hypothetical protein
MDTEEIECYDVNWIHVAQDGEQGRAVVDPVMDFGFRKISGTSWPVQQVLAFQGLCPLELVSSLRYPLILTSA